MRLGEAHVDWSESSSEGCVPQVDALLPSQQGVRHFAASWACVAGAGSREAHPPRTRNPGSGRGRDRPTGGVSRVIHSVHDCEP